jgi:zinc transport system permease protein
LLALASGVHSQEEFYEWITPVMVAFGILVGLGIAWVRQTSGLSADTVIGVFFAGALGIGAILLKFVRQRRYFNPDDFLFGNPLMVSGQDLLRLIILVLVVAVVLGFLYNQLILSNFNMTLALSRRVRVGMCNAIFIVLLALVVNLCLQAVGALLINAMLVVPAATAANVSRNMRQLFWYTIGLCLFVGVLGHYLSWVVQVPSASGGEKLSFEGGGIMVVLSVVLFSLSMMVRPLMERRGVSPPAS